MLEQKRLSRPTSLTQKLGISFAQLKALSLALLVTFASMMLSSVGLPDLGQTVISLVAVALLTGSAIIAGESGHLFASRKIFAAEQNAWLFSLALLAWSVLLLLIFVSWQAAALALLALPCLVSMRWPETQRESSARQIPNGGLIGLPAIVGGAAATATVEVSAIILFAIVFFWSLMYSRVTLWSDKLDRPAVGVSVPAVNNAMLKRLLLIALQLVIISMLPTLLFPLIHFDSSQSVAYPVVATVMAVLVISLTSKLARDADGANPRRLRDILTVYPYVLILALIADRMLQ